MDSYQAKFLEETRHVVYESTWSIVGILMVLTSTYFLGESNKWIHVLSAGMMFSVFGAIGLLKIWILAEKQLAETRDDLLKDSVQELARRVTRLEQR